MPKPEYSNLRSNKTSKKNTIYLPGLNGLRAIAALAVVISHISLALGSFGLNAKIFGQDYLGKARGLDMAGTGVTIFFTLSGFLITYLLLNEKTVGSINIKHFYIRRILRIWPLYYMYLFIGILTAIFYGIKIQYNLLTFYIFILANIPFIMGNMIPFVHHYWSIAVEEQFYLFFPHLAKLKTGRLLRSSIIIIILFFCFKVACWIISKKYQIDTPLLILFVNRFHIMLMGAIAAILYFNKNKLFLSIATNKITQALCWTTMLFLALNKTNFLTIIHDEFFGLVTIFIIIAQIARKNYLINLDNKFFNFIGRISYGIYIIHPLVIYYFSKLITPFKNPSFLNYLIVFFLIILTTISFAFISNEFYEKKFLKLKGKFTSIKSSNINTSGSF